MRVCKIDQLQIMEHLFLKRIIVDCEGTEYELIFRSKQFPTVRQCILLTNEYYLRARYCDSSLSRFSQADTHWNPGNMIYGDTPQQIGEYRDALGLNRYAYAPQHDTISQAGNLYVYCFGNPIVFVDRSGKKAIPIASYGPMPELINGQGLAPFSQIRFGSSNVGDAGCGAIAVYNAMILAGCYDITFDSVLKYFTIKSWFRGFGVMPWEIDNYFRDYDVKYQGTSNLEDITQHLLNGGIAIVTFWNDSVTAMVPLFLYDIELLDSSNYSGTYLEVNYPGVANPLGSAHTVTIVYDSASSVYIIYNPYNEYGKEERVHTIDQYLESGVVIYGYCI